MVNYCLYRPVNAQVPKRSSINKLQILLGHQNKPVLLHEYNHIDSKYYSALHYYMPLVPVGTIL